MCSAYYLKNNSLKKIKIGGSNMSVGRLGLRPWTLTKHEESVANELVVNYATGELASMTLMRYVKIIMYLAL